MTGQKQVDPPTLESLAQSYTTLERDATAISAYLHANCQLDNSIGLLLFWLRPMFEQGRDHGFTAFANASAALKGAAHQVTGALHDAEVAEAEREELLRALQALPTTTFRPTPPRQPVSLTTPDRARPARSEPFLEESE